MAIEIVPAGRDATDPQPGDFILCHRRGLASAIIRWGERLRFHKNAQWSHAAFIDTPETVIEALTHGVSHTPLSHYRHIKYAIVRTHMEPRDQAQAVAFARSCLNDRYGFLIDLGIALRFLLPGRGLWFGMSGTEICSGLVGQSLVRGWAIFPMNPSALSPSELAEWALSVDATSAHP